MPNEPAPSRTSGRNEIDAFLEQRRLQRRVASGGRGRLIFAIDATASRQPTWDLAVKLQGEMFEAANGGLDLQLHYFRGLRECSASRWVSDAQILSGLMEKVDCRTGVTQIGRVLAHAREENARQKVSALVFVGDAMEETPAELYVAAARAWDADVLIPRRRRSRGEQGLPGDSCDHEGRLLPLRPGGCRSTA